MYLLYGSEWSTSRPSCFIPEKEPRYPVKRTLGEGGPSAGLIAYETHREVDNTTEKAELHKYTCDCNISQIYAITTARNGIFELCIDACLFSTRLPLIVEVIAVFRSLTPFYQGTLSYVTLNLSTLTYACL